MLWAYATSEHFSPELFDASASEAIQRLAAFKTQEISNLLWAYGKIGHASPDLFDEAAIEVVKKMNVFKPQELSNMMFAFARNGHSSPQLFDIAAEEAIRKIDIFKTQEISNTLWSLAVMNCNVESALLLFPTVLEIHDSETISFSSDELRQLHQVILWLTIENQRMCNIPDELEEKCLSAFLRQQKQLSKFQNNVMSSFESLDLNVQEEVTCQRTGYSIDAIVTTKDGIEIAVEVDGPSHFVGRLPTGSSILKRRLLKNIGSWPLLSLPYWKWNEVGLDEKKQQALLEAEIKNVSLDIK
mmetsp:Transcript_29552/g.44775  ORF Transcript_29552/g.44775 Transcript_29552/m.44775 type:complete len:300 (+) Transcript_29552:3-902(+)